MRIEFTISGINVSDAQMKANIAHARSLGLPPVADRAGGKALNVVGRGPSVAGHAEFLRHDDADVWACGTAWAWCRDNGIDATLVAVDAHPNMAKAEYLDGVTRAVVASQCDPAVFAALSCAQVELADDDQSNLGSTAAVVAMVIGAAFARYRQVRLFGCEGSYGDTTHANEDIPQPYLMAVRCNGEVFRTNPQMLIQCEEFCQVIRMVTKPDLFVDRSGGLLGAMLATGGEWDLLSYRNAPEHIRKMLEAA